MELIPFVDDDDDEMFNILRMKFMSTMCVICCTTIDR
jgi:hypothetical protein